MACFDVKHKKCAEDECTKRPNFNYKDQTQPLYCVKHKKNDMVNIISKLCEYNNCTTQSVYNYEGSKKGMFCNEHKKEGMIDIKKRKCAEKNCDKQPSFNYKGYKIGINCNEHKKEGMIALHAKKCMDNDCISRPTFNYKGDSIPIYCKSHKKDDMIDITHKSCNFSNCTLRPNFNYGGNIQGIYCKEHKMDNMIDVTNKKCIHKGCISRPSFNHKEQIGAIYCKEHKEDGMICVATKKCEYVNCYLTPSFNYEGNIKGIFCKEHKKDNMIDIKNKKCFEKGCNTQPHFNYIGKLSGLYCNEHKKEKMVEVINKKCTTSECIIRANYGIPGSKPSKCFSHRKAGMINTPRHCCESNQCNNIAIFGYKTAIYCDSHKLNNMINLIEKECKQCKLIWLLNKDGVCTYCDPNHFNGFRLSKQRDVKLWLDNNKYIYESYDGTIDKGICSKYRPDFVFEAINKTHYVVLEVDEYQHSFHNKNYTEECECVRMVNISQSLGMPTIFIRYNPDEYKLNNKTINIKHNTRMKTLKIILNSALTKSIDDIINYGFLSYVQLFYDDFVESKIEYKTVMEFDNKTNDNLN